MSVKEYITYEMTKRNLSIAGLASQLDKFNQTHSILLKKEGNEEPSTVRITYEHVKRLLHYTNPNRLPKKEMIQLLAAIFEISYEEFINRCHQPYVSSNPIQVDDVSKFIDKFGWSEAEICDKLLEIDQQNKLPDSERGEKEQWINIMSILPESTHLFYIMNHGTPQIIGDLTMVLLSSPDKYTSDSDVFFGDILPMRLSGKYPAWILSLQLIKEYLDLSFLIQQLLSEILRLSKKGVLLSSLYVRGYGENLQLYNVLGFESTESNRVLSIDTSYRLCLNDPINSFKKMIEEYAFEDKTLINLVDELTKTYSRR